MTLPPDFSSLSPAIAGALTRRGFIALTPVQKAVLDPALEGRDLRIFSQTGSGKTVAVGLVLAPFLEGAGARAEAKNDSSSSPEGRVVGRPDSIVIAPTRELAAQLARELTWLFEPIGVKVCSVVGGSSYPSELRALRQRPRVIVGTPGRMLDHLERGSIELSNARAVVLDEADQMLDLGFREELNAILDRAPEARRTHLVSATFPREVQALADRYQSAPVVVEGSRLGVAHEDINHVAHLVRPDERDAALTNLLLLAPGERTLVFVRTREGASRLADHLAEKGFRARAISGELEQSERTRTLEGFRTGAISVLVATDVAARGLDVPDVSRVIHADPPGDADALTHRSGRTGRAGRKGTSIVLAPPFARELVERLYRRARVEGSFLPAPSQDEVRRAAEDRLFTELVTEATAAVPVPQQSKKDARKNGRNRALGMLADRLLEQLDARDLVAALLARAGSSGPCEPLPVTAIARVSSAAPAPRGRSGPRTPYNRRRTFEGPRA